MEERVKAYFSDLQFRFDIVKNHSIETNKYLSTKFNVFDYINPDENGLSDIIADLLNPNGKHGQTDLFLKEFIKIIKCNEFILSTLPKVETQVKTTNIVRTQRSMDILIHWDSYAIMLENKPWATDQIEQINDYKIHLENKYQGKYLIVYLTKNHQDPSEDSISSFHLQILKQNNKYINITFNNEIFTWVSNCIKESQSDKIRHFLKDFLTYLKNNFN